MGKPTGHDEINVFHYNLMLITNLGMIGQYQRVTSRQNQLDEYMLVYET